MVVLVLWRSSRTSVGPESKSSGDVVVPVTLPDPSSSHMNRHVSVVTQDGTARDATVGASVKTRAG